MLRVDPDKVEAQIAQMVAALEPKSKGSGTEAVLMRMQIALIPAFMRWKLSEMNTGETTDNQMCNAFVAFTAAQMGGLIADCADTEGERYPLANNMLQGIGEELATIFSGAAHVTQRTIPAEPVN